MCQACPTPDAVRTIPQKSLDQLHSTAGTILGAAIVQSATLGVNAAELRDIIERGIIAAEKGGLFR